MTLAHTPPLEISAQDLPLHCPPAGAPAWNLHPRVFLAIQANGEAVCPYCSARYHLKGALPQGH